jgi:hypothetical protein
MFSDREDLPNISEGLDLPFDLLVVVVVPNVSDISLATFMFFGAKIIFKAWLSINVSASSCP